MRASPVTSTVTVTPSLLEFYVSGSAHLRMAEPVGPFFNQLHETHDQTSLGPVLIPSTLSIVCVGTCVAVFLFIAEYEIIVRQQHASLPQPTYFHTNFQNVKHTRMWYFCWAYISQELVDLSRPKCAA